MKKCPYCKSELVKIRKLTTKEKKLLEAFNGATPKNDFLMGCKKCREVRE